MKLLTHEVEQYAPRSEVTIVIDELESIIPYLNGHLKGMQVKKIWRAIDLIRELSEGKIA